MANEGTDEPRYEGDALLLPGRVERLEHQAAEAKKREDQYRDEQLTTNRRIAQFTGLLVLCTLATAGVGLWQAHISNKAASAAQTAAQAAADNATTAKNTLTEIQKGSADTHELALQAKNQADRTGDVATSALAQATATNVLAIEAKRSAETAQRQLIQSVRPWVGLSDDAPDIETTPIRFDDKGNASVQYQVNVKNFGNYAAQNVFAIAFLLVTQDLDAVYAQQRESCRNYVSNSEIGNVLFPGRNRTGTHSSSQFPRSRMVSRTYTGQWTAWLVGCIGYRDQFKTLYHTGFVYWFADPKTRQPFAFDPPAPNSELPGIFVPHGGSIDEPKEQK